MKTNTDKAFKRIINIYSVFIVLFPILNIYSIGIPSVGIGDGMAVLFLLYLTAIRQPIKTTEYHYYSLFFLYIIIISLFLTVFNMNYSFSETVIKCFKFAVYTYFAICLSNDYLDVPKCFKWYINISLIASLYLIIQYLMESFMSIVLPMTIPFLYLMYGNITGREYESVYLPNIIKYEQYRASGFFLEPAQFCQYVIISVVILLCYKDGIKHRKLKLLIISLAILFSFSAIGYYMLIATFVSWYILNAKRKMTIRNMLLGIIGVVAGIIVSIKSGAWSSAMERVDTISYSHAATGNMRLLRGVIAYREFPFFYKVFGIGAGNYSAFINQYNIHTFIDNVIDRNIEYMSAISTVLVYGGIIGIFLYVGALTEMVKKASKIQKIFFVVFLILIISTNSFLSAIYVAFIVLITNSSIRLLDKDEI